MKPAWLYEAGVFRRVFVHEDGRLFFWPFRPEISLPAPPPAIAQVLCLPLQDEEQLSRAA